MKNDEKTKLKMKMKLRMKEKYIIINGERVKQQPDSWLIVILLCKAMQICTKCAVRDTTIIFSVKPIIMSFVI